MRIDEISPDFSKEIITVSLKSPVRRREIDVKNLLSQCPGDLTILPNPIMHTCTVL